MHINKWSMFHFPWAEPSLLAGHPGFDDFSGALLHDKTRAVQTLSKVCFKTTAVQNKNVVFDLHLIWLHLFVYQWELWKIIPGCHQPHQQHLHQIRVWHCYRPRELWEGKSCLDQVLTTISPWSHLEFSQMYNWVYCKESNILSPYVASSVWIVDSGL